MRSQRAALLRRISNFVALSASYPLFLVLVMPCSPAQVHENCLKVTKIFTNYDALRQGSEVDTYLTLHAEHCTLAPMDVDHSYAKYQKLVQVKADPRLHVKVTAITSAGTAQMGQLVVYGARERDLSLQIAADADLPIGIMRPSLVFTYDTIDLHGLRTPRSIEIELPVRVVAHDSAVIKQYDNSKWGWKDTLLLPFRLIEAIVSGTGS